MINELMPFRKHENQLSPVDKQMGPVGELYKQVNEIFNRFLGDNGLWPLARFTSETFFPQFEVNENADRIVVTAELPGVEMKNIDVSVEDGFLCVKGEKHCESESDDKNCHFSERSYGSFRREFTLPNGIDLEKLDAKFKNGVLKITLPKSEEKRKKVKKITVNHD